VPVLTITPDIRIAGVLAPLFALRSKRDLGVGDLGCLRELVDWAADTGFRLVQLLPINETGADNSPYMAVSSAAIEPTTIEIAPERVPGLTQEVIDEVLAKIDLTQLRKGQAAQTRAPPGRLRKLFQDRPLQKHRPGAEIPSLGDRAGRVDRGLRIIPGADG